MAKKGKKGGGNKGGGVKGKNVEKKKEKVINDRTFGMKNKGGRKARETVKQMKNAQKSSKQMRTEEQRRLLLKKSKLDAQKEKDELSKLFRAVQSKPGVGGDPKSVICEFFKKGACKKGKKCKFSHDWSQVRKTEKLDIYEDRRDEEADMKNWDQEKLEEVVKSKENRCQTDIICKFFLDALEKQQYGYFWVCPNGGTQCMYRHALPPGYVLKTKKEKDQDDENVDDGPSLEERLEEMRLALSGRTDLTKVTLETFNQWKATRKQKATQERQDKAKEATKKGKVDSLSGRDLFEFDPTVFEDDAEADDEQYVIDSDNEGDSEYKDEEPQNTKQHDPETNSTATEVSNGFVQTKDASISKTVPVVSDNVVIDESLFLDEDFDDIDLSDED